MPTGMNSPLYNRPRRMVHQQLVACYLLLIAGAAAFQSASFSDRISATPRPDILSYASRRSSALLATRVTEEKKRSPESSLNGDDSAVESFPMPSAVENALQKDPDSSGNDLFSGLAWRGVVVVLCALWASNFPAAKLVMAEPGVDSSLYAVARFSLAAAALAPGALAVIRRIGLDAETLKGAISCGSWVAFGYLGQTFGLLTTTASRSCVICSLHCVFVAMIAELWRVSRAAENGLKTKFDVIRLLPAAVAVAGVAIVELKGAAGPPNVGDLLSFAQPIGFGMGYLQLEELMAKRPDAALPVSAIKLLVVALASFCTFELAPLITNGFGSVSDLALRLPDFTPILSSPLALGGIMYTGLVTTAMALWVESIAFARVPATDASIILTTEPLIAAAIGAVALGETFGVSDYVGASLIIGACAFAAFLDTPGEPDCDPDEDENCEPPHQWPFFSGF